MKVKVSRQPHRRYSHLPPSSSTLAWPVHLQAAGAAEGLAEREGAEQRPAGERSMNGGVDYLLSEEVIHLTRGPSGLGFNIVGGTDQQYIANDSSIYVSRIKENGAAALDGRLQEGDKIIAVNDSELKNMLHKNVVELFRTAGDNVSLKVQHRLLPQNGPSSHRGDGDPGGIPLTMILVPGLAIAAAATLLWAFLRYRQRV